MFLSCTFIENEGSQNKRKLILRSTNSECLNLICIKEVNIEHFLELYARFPYFIAWHQVCDYCIMLLVQKVKKRSYALIIHKK